MTVFLIGAALLMAVALAFLLPPLLRKEQAADHVQRDQLNLAVLRDQLRELESDREAGLIEQAAYDSARHELERRVAEEVLPTQAAASVSSGEKRWVAGAVGVAVPVIAISVYMLIGSPQAMDPTQQVAAAHQQDSHEVTAEQIEGMITTLAARMQNEPDNVEGWYMLARSYNATGRYKEAADAYARLVQLVPNDSNMLADYADTLAMALGRTLIGEPEKLAAKAVQIDPQNIKAIALWGSAAFERKDYAAAAERWQKIMTLVPADSDVARSISGSIAEAQKLAGVAPTAQAKPAAPAVAGGAKVTGTVDIDPALRAQVADTDTVFIFARAAEGPRFPLAVLRKQVKDLPASFELNDSMSMMPEAKLSSVPMVVVGARVSKDGSATPAPGDLEGVTAPVAPGAANLKITINRKNG